MNRVTIEHLELQFDVVGDGDEAVFARLFESHMRRHAQAELARRDRDRRLERESRLGDRSPEVPT